MYVNRYIQPIEASKLQPRRDHCIQASLRSLPPRGALATSAFGTALGVIRASWESGRRFKVFNTETRPFLQGARLTSWEFKQLGIPATLLVDSAAGRLIRSCEISCVITGADRIASNGDTANKIGTYS